MVYATRCCMQALRMDHRACTLCCLDTCALKDGSMLRAHCSELQKPNNQKINCMDIICISHHRAHWQHFSNRYRFLHQNIQWHKPPDCSSCFCQGCKCQRHMMSQMVLEVQLCGMVQINQKTYKPECIRKMIIHKMCTNIHTSYND